MTETQALRMMVEQLFCAGCYGKDYDESLKVIDYYTKTEKGKKHLKKIRSEWEEYRKNNV